MLDSLHKRSIILVALLLFLILPSVTYADETNNYNSKVFLVIVNRLSLFDIENMSNLKAIIEDGSIGLMNTRGVTGYKGAEGYITINASSKAYSSYETASSFNLNEETRAVYERRTGKSTGEYKIANIEINKLYSLNNNSAYKSAIGALGDNLHNSGHKTAVFGNSDTADSFIRTNCLIAIDSNGLIDFGNVDEILVKDNDYPFGVKTDFDKILKEINSLNLEASLFVIETGDMDRLSLYSNNLSEDMFLELKRKILSDIDRFIGNLFMDIDNKSMLIIASPNSPENEFDNSKLSPLVIWDGKEYKGVLTSGTTRRSGIVANIDIAPTITNYLNARDNNFIGHTIIASNVNDKLNFIKHLNNRVNIVSTLRAPYLNFYSFLSIVVFILGIFLIFGRGAYANKIRLLMKLLLLLILVTPLVFLLIAYFNVVNSIAFFTLVFLLTISMLVIIYFIKDDYRIIVLLTMTYLALLIDLLLDGNLLKYSILSYDPIIGARYFGIGNELTGVILAIMILLITLCMEKSKGNKLFLLILPATVFIVSHPNLGANVGGTISVLFASMIFILYFFRVRINLKKIFIIGIIVLLFIIIMGLIDIYINANPTHLGKTFIMILNSGPMSIISVILRKTQMNIKLIRNSIWSKVLLTTILSEVYMLLRCKKQITSIIHKNKYISAGLISTLVGSIIGLLVNDSGVLLAAIANIYLVAILMYYITDHMIEA